MPKTKKPKSDAVLDPLALRERAIEDEVEGAETMELQQIIEHYHPPVDPMTEEEREAAGEEQAAREEAEVAARDAAIVAWLDAEAEYKEANDAPA